MDTTMIRSETPFRLLDPSARERRSQMLILGGGLAYALAALVPWHTGASLALGSCSPSGGGARTGPGLAGVCSVATESHLSGPVDHFGFGLMPILGAATIVAMLVVAILAFRRHGRGLAGATIGASGLALVCLAAQWTSRPTGPSATGGSRYLLEPFGTTHAFYIALGAAILTLVGGLGLMARTKRA